MRMPAGFPWRVITISSRSASRRYFERSSLTFARATSRFGNAFFGKPGFRFGFGDDGEDLDRLACDVIEHPDVVHSEPKLRAAQPPEPLDAALTGLGPQQARGRSRSAFWLEYSHIWRS